MLGLGGEGAVPAHALQQAASSFSSSSISGGCQGKGLLSEWYDADELLDLLATSPLRIAYDCTPKRFRAQFICLLNRAAAAEAVRNDSCVRGPWQAALAQFPEVFLWRML